jgi:hypothetical protein
MCLGKGMLLLKKGQRKRKRFNNKACEEIKTAYSNSFSEKYGGLSLKDQDKKKANMVTGRKLGTHDRHNTTKN